MGMISSRRASEGREQVASTHYFLRRTISDVDVNAEKIRVVTSPSGDRLPVVKLFALTRTR